ncbi:hypothetical protein ACOBWA_00075 [Psychrobacter sp. ER1]
MSNDTTFKALVVEETSDGEFKKAFKSAKSVTCQKMICSSKCIIHR